MSLSVADIDDLVLGTLEHMDRPNFGMIATELTDYVVMPDMFHEQSARIENGKTVRDDLMVSHKKSAQHTKLYAEDSFVMEDNLQKIETPWRFTTDNYIYDYREIPINGGASKIVDYLSKKRLNALLSLADKLEYSFFQAPSSSTDEVTPWGLQYWLKSPGAAETPGFNGGNVTGFSAGPGGLSADTYARWKNYNGRYSTFDDDGLVSAMKKTARNTAFKAPVRVKGMRSEKITRRIWTGENVLEQVDLLAQSKNDNLGTDLGTYGDDGVTFKRTPFTYVPVIDEIFSDDDIFMIDKNTFKIVILGEGNMMETGPKDVANRHTVRAIHIDFSWNVHCRNRRHQAWLKK